MSEAPDRTGSVLFQYSKQYVFDDIEYFYLLVPTTPVDIVADLRGVHWQEVVRFLKE